MEETKPKIGEMLRGQGWLELHGLFTLAELRTLIEQIEYNCKGLEKNGNQE